MDEKIEIFTKLVLGGAERECGARLERLREEHRLAVETRERELGERTLHVVERARQLANRRKNQLVSKVREESRRTMLHERERILELFIGDLTSRLRGMRGGEEYVRYREACLKRGLEELGTDAPKVLVNEDEVESWRAVDPGAGRTMTVEPSPRDLVGGMVLIDPVKGFSLDYSFATAIEGLRYDMGKRLHSIIGTVGDADE